MKPPVNYLKGPVPYDVISCGECDGLDCDKCSLSTEPLDTSDDRKARMQEEDESNYLLNPLRI